MSRQKDRKLRREGEAKVYGPTLNHPHFWFWKTKLTPERRVQINEWLASLDEKHLNMIHDLTTDVQAQAEWDALEEASNERAMEQMNRVEYD